MELHIRVISLLLIVLAIVHIIFPRYFNWSREFSGVSLINRQMMYIHAFFIAFVVLLMGVLCWTSSYEIVNTALGKKVALGLGIFWATRLAFQFFGYSSEVHIVFAILWTYMSAVFVMVYLE